MRIPLFRTKIRNEAADAVAEVLASGWLGLGPKTEAFEKEFGHYIGAPFCVGLNSCTSALHLALRLLDLAPGTEIITTAMTFVSTNHVILYERCRPVFADIHRFTGNLDVDSVRKCIRDETGAIILMHYGGYPCDLDAFYALSKEMKTPIIEDCSHACGASYKGKRIGSTEGMQAFSFQAVKNLPIGDGGALTVQSEDHYRRLKRLRWLGISKDTFERLEDDGYRWKYDVPEIGFKYHMNDIDAAIGLVQLRYLDQDNAYRKKLSLLYKKCLQDISGIQFLRHKEGRESSHHLFNILVENRDQLVKKLRSSGVDASVHYFRNDLYPMFQRQDLPNTEYFSNHVISLPLHLLLTEEHVQYICDVIKSGW